MPNAARYWVLAQMTCSALKIQLDRYSLDYMLCQIPWQPQHPKDMVNPKIEAFVSHLTTHRKVAASNQRQALDALVFWYKYVLNMPIGDNIAPVKAKKRRCPPVVITKAGVRQVLNQWFIDIVSSFACVQIHL